MKTTQDDFFKNTPPLVLQIMIMSNGGNGFVSRELLNKAIAEHPEYFPEEVEHRRKWAAVPQEVRDQYYDELFEHYKSSSDDSPFDGRGIVYWMEHPEEYQEKMKNYDAWSKQETLRRKKLHEKYFAKYDIPFLD